MMYSEFENLIKTPAPSHDEYTEIIEVVYTWYPSDMDKEQTALLYDLYGIKIFRDLLPRAKAMQEANKEFQRLSRELKEVREKMDMIKSGYNPYME